jgi:hypothetical protein
LAKVLVVLRVADESACLLIVVILGEELKLFLELLGGTIFCCGLGAFLLTCPRGAREAGHRERASSGARAGGSRCLLLCANTGHGIAFLTPALGARRAWTEARELENPAPCGGIVSVLLSVTVSSWISVERSVSTLSGG